MYIVNEGLSSGNEEMNSSGVLSSLNPLQRARLKYDSLDYDELENDITTSESISRTRMFFMSTKVVRWILTGFIGIFVAILAFLVDIGTRWIITGRFYIILLLLEIYPDSFWLPFSVYVLMSCILVSMSYLLVIGFEPVAGGSGIGEIKCYLNGVKIPHALRIKTLFAKLLGTMFSVGSGLPVGPEGPMIHMGAITAAGLSQGKSTTFRSLDINYFSIFRNDREKRDFVNGGAAAGMAAALGAPIGGTLFALEEAASFWNEALTWRTLFCSMTAAFFVNFLLSGIEYHDWGGFSQPGLVNFGTFAKQPKHGYTIAQLPFFMVLGVIGGFLGAFFNSLNKLLSLFRAKYINSPLKRTVEVIFVAALTSICSFILSYYFHRCIRLDWKNTSSSGAQDYMNLQFFCPAGYYNDMAMIFFTGQVDAIKQLLHNEGDFALSTLILFAFTYFFLACWTFGLPIPSGLFVPSLLTGAAIGRLWGSILSHALPDWPLNPGTFALMGAAAVLGGKTRTTISLTVILLESTNDVTYGLPLMLTLMISKWVADRFNPGIYNIHIKLRNIPFLDWEPDQILCKLKAYHIMSSPVKTFSPIERVSTIYNTLKNTTHNGLPIISEDGVFFGLILRTQLLTILKKKAFCIEASLDKRSYEKVTAADFAGQYPRSISLEDLILSREQMEMYADLATYMSRNIETVQVGTSMNRVFRLFRSLGLRHLIVEDIVYAQEKFQKRKLITYPE